MYESTNTIKTYKIVKKGLFVRLRANNELNKIKNKENIDILSITASYDFSNPLNMFKNEYKIIYKKII